MIIWKARTFYDHFLNKVGHPVLPSLTIKLLMMLQRNATSFSPLLIGENEDEKLNEVVQEA